LAEVEINSGICGFKTKVKTTSLSKYQCSLQIESECKHVRKLAEQLNEVDAMAELFKKGQSQVKSAADNTIPHITCPVPTGILKSLEVATGLALPKDASIKFLE